VAQPSPQVGVKIFADGADLDGMLQLASDPRIAGFTTNPTLMRKSGVSDFEGFARKVLGHVTEHPVSLEVFADEFEDMARQARKLASWGPNVLVKIPISNTRAESSVPLIRNLSEEGLGLNVTAVMNVAQVQATTEALASGPGAIVSVFAGRIADTGRDPIPIMRECVSVLADFQHLELLWASPREVLNVYQADEIGCDIITVTPDLLEKLSLRGKDLVDYSLETVKMFHGDAVKAGFLL
jgi:transaldolase